MEKAIIRDHLNDSTKGEFQDLFWTIQPSDMYR